MLCQCFVSPNVSSQPTSSNRFLFSFFLFLLWIADYLCQAFHGIRHVPNIAVLSAFFQRVLGLFLWRCYSPGTGRHSAMCQFRDPAQKIRRITPYLALYAWNQSFARLPTLPCSDSHTWQLCRFGAPWYGDAAADTVSCPVCACRLGVALVCSMLLCGLH